MSEHGAVSSQRVLGDIINNQLTATDHVSNILATVLQQSAIRFADSTQPRQTRNVAAWCFPRDRHLEADHLFIYLFITLSSSNACSAADHAKL